MTDGRSIGTQTIIEPSSRQKQGRVVGVLIGIKGNLEDEVYKIFDGEHKIGRGEDCQPRLPSERISREHARLIHENGRFAIESMNERNPTMINSIEKTSGTLKDGDELKLGRIDVFRFRAV